MRWYGDQIVCAILGIEGEANLNYAMVARDFIYTAYRYNEQLTRIRKQHRRKKDLRGAEYLAGFAETDRLVPVLIVCVYYGKEPWTAPTHLHELLDFKEFTQEEELLLRNLVGDYQLQVLDVRHMEEALIDGMQTDLKHLFKLVRCSEDSEALLEYIRNNREELDNLDEDIFEAAAAIGEMKQLQEITEKTEGGPVEMCKALDDIISNAEERGREIGMKRGREIGEEVGMERGREIGEEIGIERGKEEGSRLKALEIARQLLGVLDIATIAEKTGLALETVQEFFEKEVPENTMKAE